VKRNVRRMIDSLSWRAALAAGLLACGAAVAMVQILALTGAPDYARAILPIAGAALGTGLALGVLGATARAQREGDRDALNDPDSGLASRAVAEHMLALDFAAAQAGEPLSVVLFRIDRFPRFAARHGREAARAALQNFGDALNARTRGMHLAARYGEEPATFLTILSRVPLDGACVFADRARAELAALHPGDLGSVSAGVASYEPEMTGPAMLLARAERALAGADGGWIVAVAEG
jgi:diguanylate cyclase (GGDEF)-like protein